MSSLTRSNPNPTGGTSTCTGTRIAPVGILWKVFIYHSIIQSKVTAEVRNPGYCTWYCCTGRSVRVLIAPELPPNPNFLLNTVPHTSRIRAVCEPKPEASTFFHDQLGSSTESTGCCRARGCIGIVVFAQCNRACFVGSRWPIVQPYIGLSPVYSSAQLRSAPCPPPGARLQWHNSVPHPRNGRIS